MGFPFFIRYDLAIEILKDTRVFSSNFSTLLAGIEENERELQKISDQGWPQMNTLLTADPQNTSDRV